MPIRRQGPTNNLSASFWTDNLIYCWNYWTNYKMDRWTVERQLFLFFGISFFTILHVD